MMDAPNITPRGDRHGGKQVELVADGKTAYYRKPRSARTETALEAFLLKLKQEGFRFLPACEQVLAQGADWYHAAVVPHTPAQSRADAALYFRRCGALIFLAYLFGSTDLHEENIVACRDTPVLVDAETLFSASAVPAGEERRDLTASVLCSHLLPNWHVVDGRPVLCAGLIGADPKADNMLLLDGQPCYIYDYENEVNAGFSNAYVSAMMQRARLRDALAAFAGCECRVLLRPTEVYARMRRFAQTLPEDQRLSALTVLLSAAHEKDVRPGRAAFMEPVTAAEAQALLRGDIPRFTVLYEDCGLLCDGVCVRPAFFTRSPAETVADRLAALNMNDMVAQSRILSQAIAAVRPPERRAPAPMRCGSAVRQAVDLLERGASAALSTGWMHLESGADGNLYLQSAGYGLYDGLPGILCAYAALYRRTDDPWILNKLLEHYAPFSEMIARMQPMPLNDRRGSLQSGLGGMLAALGHLFTLTLRSEFRNDAMRLLSLLQPALEDGCTGDVLGGVAGLALQLPKFPRALTQPLARVLLPKLRACTTNLTGVAHGASGLALALAAAQFCLDSNEADDEILRLLAFEEDYYDPAQRNWRDLRTDDPAAFMRGWCSGAPGIAMSRKCLTDLTENPAILACCERDLARAEAFLTALPLPARDCLCCGLSARLTARAMLGLPADPAASGLRERLLAERLVLFHPFDTDDRNYGLMQGAAGVIYALAMQGSELSGEMLV